MSNLFYYTDYKVDANDASIATTVNGFSFNLDDVILTYPDSEEPILNVVLSMGSDKLNPVEYQYKVDPKTKQRVPVKVSKFEITNEPIVVQLKVKEEINSFFKLTGGPEW
jgi:hypothetical protein